MRIILVLIALFGSPISANGQDRSLPQSMWDDDCTVQQTADETILSQIEAQAERGDLILTQLARMTDFIDQGEWEDDTSLIDQMSSAEVAYFEGLTQQLRNAQFAELIEGKRERDLRAISGMASISLQLSKDVSVPSEPDEKQRVYGEILDLAEEVMFVEDTVFANYLSEGPCTLENALYAEALNAYDRASNVYGWVQAQEDLTALSERYGGGPLEKSTMSLRDFETLEQDIRPVITEVARRLSLAQSMLRLGMLEKMSKQYHQARRLDQYEAPGDITFSGTNWTRTLEASNFTTLELIASKVLDRLDELVPPEIIQQLDAINEVPE